MTVADRIKYPRTLHHPTSPGVQSDDKVAKDLSLLEGQMVVITDKMDGENTTLYRDGYHARSLDSGFHPSRSWLAGFHGSIAHLIPDGWRICGENLYARHSVAYADLPSYFMAFSVWTDRNTCLSYDDEQDFLEERGIPHTPLIARGAYSESLIEDAAQSIDTNQKEGIVVRLASAFAFADFQRAVIKWVRAGHVQAETHWRSGPITPNGLKTEALT